MAAKRSTPVSSLHEQVVDRLGALIARGDMAGGATFKIEELAAEYGVSRSVMREAVRELQTLGMVSSQRRVGSVIQDKDNWQLFHPRVIQWRIDSGDIRHQLNSLTELRIAIEPIAAALAAQRRTARQAERLIALANEIYESGAAADDERFVRADAAFHTLVLQSYDNELYMSLADSVTAALKGRARHGLLPVQVMHSFELHQEVAFAIEARDPVRAENAMRENLSDVLKEVATLTPRVVAGGPWT